MIITTVTSDVSALRPVAGPSEDLLERRVVLVAERGARDSADRVFAVVDISVEYRHEAWHAAVAAK